jgi:hypothetical protein
VPPAVARPGARGGGHAPPGQRGFAARGAAGGDDSRASPCAPYQPDRRGLLPWPGAPPAEPGAPVRTAGGSTPCKADRTLHQCAGSRRLHARVDRAAGEAALIVAYSTHPTCQVEGRSSPGPRIPGRTGHTTRPDREFNPMQSGQDPMHQCAPQSGNRGWAFYPSATRPDLCCDTDAATVPGCARRWRARVSI